MPPKAWAHSPTYIKSKGRFKALCLCGFQSPRCDTIAEAIEAHKEHVGVKEREVRPKK